MRIREIAGSGEELETLYSEVLTPSFPADELHTLEILRRALDDGSGPIVIAEDEDGKMLGCAIGEWEPEPRVVLLAYLAVRPGLRGGGIGGPLLEAAITGWRERFGPCLILAEVEDPDYFEGSEAHGNPKARWRFYQRRGARALDIPYFQAALRPGLSRVPHLMLVVLDTDPKFHGTAPDTVDAATVRTYLEIYQRDCEGAVGTDPQAMALWQALDRPEGVPYRS